MAAVGSENIENAEAFSAAFNELVRYVLLEGVAALFTVIGLVIVVSASIKLFRGKNIPGAKLIFYSMIFHFLGALISVYPYLLDIEENEFIEAAINIALGVAFVAGAYGLWRLAKYVVKDSAGKPLQTNVQTPLG